MANAFDTVRTKEPDKIIAGDSLFFKRTDLAADYHTASYALSYKARLEGAGSTVITINATGSGDAYSVSVPASTTAGYTPGVYHWSAYITRVSDSARVTIAEGTWTVEANNATATTDPRSHAKIMLDKIESILQGRADSDVASYTVNGRSLTKLSISDLLLWRDRYRAEYKAEQRAERAARGEPTGQTIRVRF